MSARNRVLWIAGTLYAVAILIGIWIGHHVSIWIAIAGAILLSLVYRGFAGGRGVEGGGRQRNRNRNRNRDRA